MIGKVALQPKPEKVLVALGLLVIFTLGFLAVRTCLYAGTMEGRISSQEIDLGDEIRLNLSISGELDEEITIPNVAGIQISNAGQSTSVQYINGRMSSKVDYSFILVPKKAGKFSIPSFEAKIDGKLEKTSPFTITVRKPKALSKEELANQKPAIYIEQTIEKPSAFVGEPVRVEVKIYQRINILGQEEVSSDTPGTINVPVSSADRAVRKEIGGTTYLVSTRYKYVIPVRPGKLELNPYELLVEIQTARNHRNNDPFSSFFGGVSRQRKTIRSNTLQLKVEPTPLQGKPKNFSGLVGVFDGDVEIDKRTVMVGETATATFRIVGNGRLEALDAIPVKLPSSLKIYPDKPSIEANPSASMYQVSGVYKIALVPTQAGQVPLKPVKIDYFDPESKSYKTLVFELGSLNINENPEAQFTSRTPQHPKLQNEANSAFDSQGDNSQNSEKLIIANSYDPGFFTAANILKTLVLLAVLWVFLVIFLFFEKRGITFTTKRKRFNSRVKADLISLLSTMEGSSNLQGQKLKQVFDMAKNLCAELEGVQEGSLTWREICRIIAQKTHTNEKQRNQLESFFETLEAMAFKSKASEQDLTTLLQNIHGVKQILENT